MANARIIPLFYVWEKGSVRVMARVEGDGGAAAKQSEITGILLKITRLPSLTVVVPPLLVVANVIFDTLLTDSRWTKDAIGYNFAHVIDGATYLTKADEIHRLEYTFDPSGAGEFDFPVPLDVMPRQIHGLT